MKCKKCSSDRIISLTAKCSDCCAVTFKDIESHDYVLDDIGIGGGDYIEFSYCLNCGSIQGNFPLKESLIEKDLTDQEINDFYEDYFEEGETLSKKYHYHALEEAENISIKFFSFIKYLIKSNIKLPKVEKFLEMYRTQNYEIE